MKKSNPGLSKKEKGEQNSKRVKDWIDATPLSAVPTNQFGRANVQTILEKTLGISKSTLDSNQNINKAFKELDKRIAEQKKIDIAIEHRVRRTGSIAALHRELADLSEIVRRLEYLENTGMTIL